MSWLLDGVREAAAKPDLQHGRIVRDAKLAVWKELHARWGADALLRHLPAISAVLQRAAGEERA